ncbi:Phospho-N-acetylmuramoyl-pentapeptide-transferase [Desulfofundulus kuznetsovii DSM 6115]|jgi:phospho-N-acetylmuramoyl-pentapeptide-transferase|uniref:Phospho-N-acetylmuramoyl-pentapeptide-transferase n=1 Tax=Desulfofundulus kuznetsovii (strain DSM 6115 / VKM B-1805 / 17) TaxID=760568 RepID=A0AAU8PBZ3_DESK7|nr:Phospho-N-acetylmuramoyl-pentapeptide-transferase [Desulfofundulus kuznetsovii DSM 6115]
MGHNDLWLLLSKALLISLAVTLLLGPLTIPLLRRLKFGQSIRDDGPATHLSKGGTPTMGGIMFLAGTTVAGLWLARHFPEGLLVLGVTLGFGLIGFLDDYIKVALKRSLGLRAREKLFGQAILSVLLALLAVSTFGRGTDVVIPFSGFFVPGGLTLELKSWGFLLFAVLVVVFTANAVNLTDGLDGLAAGVTVPVAAALLLISLLMDKLGIAIIMAALMGGCLGFLVYNHHPARIFMGDTGSLALGGALGAAAVLTRSELFLLVIGGVYVLEALSVIIQVVSFQLFGRRVFRMSPLHHHFELGGWSEKRVVYTFWGFALVLALLGMAGLYQLG